MLATAPARTVAISACVPLAGECGPMPLQKALKHSQEGLAQSLEIRCIK